MMIINGINYSSVINKFKNKGDEMSKDNAQNQNKRKYIRVVSKNLIKILKSDAFEDNKISNIIDLSSGGIRIVTAGKCDIGSKMDIQINLAEEEVQIPAEVVVRWVKPWQGRKDVFYIGLEFVNLDSSDKNVINRFVKKMDELQSKK